MRIRHHLAPLAVLVLLLAPACSGGDDPATPSDDDTTPPAAVTDLHVMSVSGQLVTLGWTAPGDDGAAGTAAAYDLRFFFGALGDATWDAAAACATEPDPAAAGAAQAAIVDVGGKSMVQFALKTVDDAGNWSALSNVVDAPMADEFLVRQLTADGSNRQPSLDQGWVVWVRANSVDGDEIMIANLDSPAPAPTVLTGNGGEKENPDNHGNTRLVWQGRGGPSDDWEIWLYDQVAVPRYRALTDNDARDLFPVLDVGGDIAWQRGPVMYETVVRWDEAMHDESVISDDCCPTAEWDNYAPRADGGEVVWHSYHRAGGQGARLRRWSGGVVEDITDLVPGGVGYQFSLHAGALAYESGGSIRYWDGAAVHDIGPGYEPSLHDGRVAFSVFDGHDWEIRYWDGAMVQVITDNDDDDLAPSLWGEHIVWERRPGGGPGQIFYTRLPD